MSEKINVAIVGCGASSVSFLRSFIELQSKTKRVNKVTIFNATDDFGVGLAYQDDLNNLMINRPIQSMSAHAINLNEFHQWLENNRDVLNDKGIDVSVVDSDSHAYLPRKVFGLYLQDILHSTIVEANLTGIEVNLKTCDIVKIQNINPYVLESSDREVFLADYVVLCTGNNLPKDVYKLKDTPLYINNPYPMADQIKALNSSCRVGIIGNSLTAIDIAISLKTLGHSGPVVMMSRTKSYPRVRGMTTHHHLKFLNVTNIENAIQHKIFLTLRDVLRWFRKELNEIHSDWRFLFKENHHGDDFLSVMKDEIAASHQKRAWQSVLSATNQVIELCWHYLDLNSKALFMEKYNRIWLKNRSPIPEENAKILVAMSESGQLDTRSSLSTLQYKPDENVYVASFNAAQPYHFDCIINATGPSKYIEPADQLLYDLMKKGFAVKNTFGGLDVDFESSSLIDQNGTAQPSLRLIGHNTTGVHYYTSSLEMIAKRSHKVAVSLSHWLHRQAESLALTEPLGHYMNRDGSVALTVCKEYHYSSTDCAVNSIPIRSGENMNPSC